MTARLYYFPEPAGILYTIDLNTAGNPVVSDLQYTQAASMASRSRGDGRTFRAFLGGQILLDVELQLCYSNSTQREIEAFINHIKRGGWFGLALDSAEAWGSYLQLPTIQNGGVSVVAGQQWYEPTISMASGTPLVFEQPAPVFKWDLVASATTITQTTTVFTHDATAFEFAPFGGAGVHVRSETFYPVCRLRGDAYQTRIMQWFRRQYFNMTLPLIYDVAAAVDIASSGGVLQVGETPADAGSSLQTILGEVERERARGTRNLAGGD